MRIVLFYHSLVSCWNNGHAHFLRGYASELIERGHDVRILEPQDGWSRKNMLKDGGPRAQEVLKRKYPSLNSTFYRPDELDLDEALDGADLVIAHEWNEPELIRALASHRQRRAYLLLFHDTHHRAATAPEEMARFELSGFDGALLYGAVLREIYLERRWIRQAWTWHEAADTRIFRPHPRGEVDGDLVWIGNWGDDERTAELEEFLIGPVRALQRRAAVYGVRFPEEALVALHRARMMYHGWLPNALAPEVFAKYRMTVHVPRRPYATLLPGIPTIRIFEALACGIPLVCAPWDDAEGLFAPGRDYLVARSGNEMTDALRGLLESPRQADAIAAHGLETIRRRHTCAHRVDELLNICRALGLASATDAAPRSSPARESQEVTT
jgi:spore maturation protein CgeB